MTHSFARQTGFARRSGAADGLLELATELYAVLTDGAPAAGYHIRRGFALRDAASKQPIKSSFTDGWLSAREQLRDGSERDRLLNPYVLAQHLRGRYDVAWTAPSWSSLVVLDIDRPALADDADIEALLAANLARDEVLAAVWRAFDFDDERQPVCLSTPGGGYHLYLPLCRSRDPAETERTWPNQWAREWVEHVLHQHGLALRPGRLELYPSGVRLRAPCGRQMALLRPQRPSDPDDLRLEPVHARYADVIDGKTGARTTVLRRQIAPMTEAFLTALQRARRPLEEWVAGGDAPPAWSATWGPFGDRAAVAAIADRKKRNASVQGDVPLFQHKEEVVEAAGAPHCGEGEGVLLRGRAFYRRIASLSQHGLTDPGTRHDGALKLAWYLGVLCNDGREEVLARVEAWLRSHEHASTTRDRSPASFVRQTLREVAHYYDTRIIHCQRRAGCAVPDLVTQPLEPRDQQVVDVHVCAAARPAASAILRLLRWHAAGDGTVPHAVELSGKVLSTVCGDGRILVTGADGSAHRRRAYVVAMEQLVALGIVALHTDYSTGHHGRRYTCWYRFGSGALPARDAAGRCILAERTIEEGTLRVVSGGARALPEVALERSPDGPSPATASDAWWVRMYRRRAFTPAEFGEGDARKLVAGPFRHRRVAAVLASAPPEPPSPPGGGCGGGDRNQMPASAPPAPAANRVRGPTGSAMRSASSAKLPDTDWKRVAFGSEAAWQRAQSRTPPQASASDEPAPLCREDQALVDSLHPELRDAFARALRSWRRRRQE